jgi:hypothetical protein
MCQGKHSRPHGFAFAEKIASTKNNSNRKRSDCMPAHISFHCPACNRKLRASAQFVGRSCACPRCGEDVVVPPQAPEEEAPVLVMDDGHRSRRGLFG